MLQQLDQKTKNTLKLADFIEKLEPDRFDMGKWGQLGEPRCICGWLMHTHGHADKQDVPTAANLLGINVFEAARLFHGEFTTKEAAAALRHLAITGEVRVRAHRGEASA